MNAMPPDAALRGTGWRDGVAGPARGHAAVAVRVAAPADTTDRTGGRVRSRPTTTRSRRPSTHVGGWMDSYVDAAFRMQARCTAPTRTIVGNWVHGWPGNARRRARTSTTSTSSCGSSTAICSGIDERRATPSRRSSGSSASTPPRSRSRRRSRAGGGRQPRTRIRPRGDASGTSTAGRCRSCGRLVTDTATGRRPARRGRRPLRPPAHHRHRRRRCRGAPAARPTAWPATCAPTRRRPDVHDRRRSTDAIAILGVPEVVAAPRGLGAGRDGRRPPDRRRAGRDVRPGQRGHPQPDPPPLARPTRSRWSPGQVEEVRVAAAAGRLPVRAGPSHPGLGGVVGLAGHLALAVPGRRSSSIAARRRRRASSCRSSRRPAVRATSPSRPSRRRRPTCPTVGGEATDGPSRSGGSTRTSSPARVTVTIHDGGEDVLDRRPAAVRGRDARADRLGRAIRPGQPRRRRRLPLARASRHRDRDPRPLEPDERPRPTSTCRWTSRWTSTASRSSSAAGTSASRAASSEPSRVDSGDEHAPHLGQGERRSPSRSSAR